jgi:myo-inositol-1(or 4)-monophosphatase
MVSAAGGAVVDAYGRPLMFDTDLTRRWSGVVAATPAIAAERAEFVRNSAPLPHSREPAEQ